MREPEEVTEARRDLGARLARLRHAKGISQHRFAPLTHYGRSTVANVETGRQKASRDFWQRCDELLSTGGVLVRAFDDLELRARRAALQTSTRSQPRSFATPTLPAFPLTDYMTDDDITIARDRLMDIVSLDNQFGGADLAAMCLRFFRSVHQRLGSGAYAPSVEVDLQALLGEIAEVAGWLCYDADRQDEVRRLNHEALYFSRLAGDRQMELLVLQNTSMHAGHLGRSHEALQVARSVLEGPYQLSPRLTSLFLIRKARAMAQAGDASALRLLREARALYEDGLRDDDPAWTWWVDERELSWHEAMALADLGQRGIAVGRFEHEPVGAARNLPIRCCTLRNRSNGHYGPCRAFRAGRQLRSRTAQLVRGPLSVAKEAVHGARRRVEFSSPGEHRRQPIFPHQSRQAAPVGQQRGHHGRGSCGRGRCRCRHRGSVCPTVGELDAHRAGRAHDPDPDEAVPHRTGPARRCVISAP